MEQDIPEDDPRNPATIADNVGDNVGDVAGMGADLYESYCGSILATAALGAAAYLHSGDLDQQMRAVLAPMLVSAVGILVSIIGIFLVRTRENATMKQLLGALSRGTNLSSLLIVAGTFGVLYLLGLDSWWRLSLAVTVGLVVGRHHRSGHRVLHLAVLPPHENGSPKADRPARPPSSSLASARGCSRPPSRSSPSSSARSAPTCWPPRAT